MSPDPGTAPRGTIGRPIRLEPLVLPGARLEPRADPDRRAALAVRIVDAAPHGTLTRYEIEVTGLEPGTHDLRDHVVRIDGTPTTDLPPLPITVESVLAVGTPRVSQPAPVPVTGLGGYTITAALTAALWLTGLVALVWLLYRQRRRETAGAIAPSPADRLSLLVDTAARRALVPAEQAEAERLVYDTWRRHLGLADTDPRELVAGLRRDPRAARAVDRLAAWLHAPTGSDPAAAPADVAAFVRELLPATAGPVEGGP